MTSVMSEAMLLFAAAVGSPPPATLAMFVTDGIATWATPTVSVIGFALVPPAAMTALLVHVTTCAAAEQVQPVPVPDTNARPVGSVSLTVIVPEVGAVP